MPIGLPFNPDITDFIALIYEKKGIVRNVAKHYKVHPETIYDYCYKRPEALKALEDVRAYKKHDFIDLAENVTFYNLARFEENPALAQRAADKVLDKLGYLRGWTGKENDDSDSKDILGKINSKLSDLIKKEENIKL